MTNDFDPKDPKITAYALGELNPDESADVEKLVHDSDDAQRAVREIRKTVGMLTEEFQKEAKPSLTKERRQAIEQTLDPRNAVEPVPPKRIANRSWKRIPAWTTACLLLVAVSAWAFQSDLFKSKQGNDTKMMAVNEKSTSIRDRILPDDRADLFAEKKALSESLNMERRLNTPGEKERSNKREESKNSPSSNQQNFGATTSDSQKAGLRSRVPSSSKDSKSRWMAPLSKEKYDRGGFGRGGRGGEPGNAGLGQNRPSRNRSRSTRFFQSQKELNRKIIRDQPGRGKSPLTTQQRSNQGIGGYEKKSDLGLNMLRRNTDKNRSLGGNYDSSQSGKNIFRAKKFNKDPSKKLSERRENLSALEKEKSSDKKDAQKLKKPNAPLTLKKKGPTRVELEESVKETEDLKMGKDVKLQLLQPEPDFPNSEEYEAIEENEFLQTLLYSHSTFSIDVDTASYSNIRRYLNSGKLPPHGSVRIEEMLNYFEYSDPAPKNDTPFEVNIESGECPWNRNHRLVRIGIKGKEIDRTDRPESNIVLLIDVSGSMKNSNKLPLVKQALGLLIEQLTEMDKIAIVTYSGKEELVLDSTTGKEKEKIMQAIDRLNAEGSTNGSAGITMAYETAVRNLVKNGNNRVILCTDGDLNVGITDENELVKLIRSHALKNDIGLSVFGFGTGNLKDKKLETLADKGNGQYRYIDSLDEAHNSFVEEMTGTLYTIAKDVKLQVEFNPAQVGMYRLIGYENRQLSMLDFYDDTKDAGEIGAGHSLTALYEIVPSATMTDAPKPMKFKYRAAPQLLDDPEHRDELLSLYIAYKPLKEEKSKFLEFSHAPQNGSSPSNDFDWAAAVAMYGLLLRDSQYAGEANLELVRELALGSKGKDQAGRRKEFIDLVGKTIELVNRQRRK